MAILTFRGGVYPDSGKENTKEKIIEDYRPKGELVFPVLQHYGSPCEPCVEIGQHVLQGELIAQAKEFYSSNVFASVSGTVKSVEPRMTALGQEILSVIIEPDEENEICDPWMTKPLDELTDEEIKFMVQWAGIVGLGGRTIPTHVKLDPADPEKIDYIIINGTECEPYKTSDYREMLEEPERILSGLKIVMRLFPNAKAIIAIEDDKPGAIIRIKELIKKENNIKVSTVYTKYPQGSQRQLIYACTKRRINSFMVPSTVGCVVLNVQTVYNINQAVSFGYPMMHRVITVSGDNVKDPKNLRVPMGTNMQEILEYCGGCITDSRKIIVGGSMTGMEVSDLNIPVTKDPSDIIILTRESSDPGYSTNCIKCGRCINSCPSRLMPSRLYKYALKGDQENFKKYDGEECIECGSCSFICPAKIELHKSIIKMRRESLANRTYWG